MTNFEIFLIIMASAIPVVAFLFVLPKKIKKEKKQEVKEVKTLADIKKEESPQEKLEDIKSEPLQTIKSEISSQDFESYADFKKRNISQPSRIELPKDFIDRTSPFVRNRAKRDNKPKNVAEEINSLSPELKAMLIAGVLDRKNFDN